MPNNNLRVFQTNDLHAGELIVNDLSEHLLLRERIELGYKIKHETVGMSNNSDSASQYEFSPNSIAIFQVA